MKHKLLSGLTAMVLVSSLSVSLSSHAEQAPLTPEVEEDKRETETVVGAATQPETTDGASNQTETHNTVVKVGEYQSNSASDGEFEPIATIQAHLWNNRQAATLYVRNIPVLTFVEETAISHQSPVTSHQLLDKREQGTSAVFPTPNSQLLTPNSDVEETEQGIGNREQGTGNRQEARVKREQVTSAILPTPNSQLLTPNSDVEETEQGIGNREQGTGNRQEARVKREQVTSAILPTPNSQLLTPNSEERGEKMPNSNVLLSSQALKQPSSDSPSQASTDPVTRASELAAKLNQLNRYQIDANSINVRWNEDQQNYSIEIAGQTLVVIDSDTILPDTTQNLAEDALQATNRLRRQMGYAPPLSKIEGKSPFNHLENAFNRRVLDAVEGWASWYGPGFHGRLTANGERFNQYEMTAAHRSLPFGTTVRVTNTNNGRSVVVRINDRGPFSGGRIIDLSVAAAEAIGMISSGVAPVKVEVLEAQ